MASKTIKGLTVEIGGDTTKLSKALKDVEAKSRSLSKELGDINKLLKLDPGNTELLAQKQKVLAEAAEEAAKKLETLKEAERQVQKQFERGEVSEEQLRALQREIVATENKMKGYQKAAEQTAQAMEDMGDGAGEAGDDAKKSAKKLDDFAEAADNAEKSSGNLGETLKNATVAGLKAVAAITAGAITGLVAAAEGTREYRTEMGKLDAAFTASGHSAGAASEAYKKLYGVIGETDQSVEAAQQIALLAESEKDVAKWADLAAGVVGRFGDALQPETFYEAANETLKLNEATGAYVQMLEGTGMSVDEFNAGLAKCTTEAEKQAYMLAVTQEALGAAGEAYKTNNAEIIRANEATDAWTQSLAGVGGAVEPIITDVKLLGASLLNEAVPAVQSLTDAFRGMMNGDAGAADQFGAAMSGLITGLISKITELLPTVAQVGISLVSTLVSTLVAQLPQMLSAGGQMIGQLLSGIVSALPQLTEKGITIVENLVSGFSMQLPVLLEKGAELIAKLGEGIALALPDLIGRGLDAAQNFATTLANAAPMIIDIGFDLLSNLISGIVSALPDLIAKVPVIISTFANIINDNFPVILKKGVELILQLIKGIISAIPDLIANIPQIITAIVDVWEAFNWTALGKKAITFLKNGITGMIGAVKTAGKSIMDACTNALKNLPSNLLNLGKNAITSLSGAIKSGVSAVKNSAMSIFNGIVDTFKSLPSKMLSIGGDIVRGIGEGISNMTGWVVGKIKDLASNILGGIKSALGIHSPSRVFRDEVGKMIPAGMAIGIEDNAKEPIKAMAAMSDDMLVATQSLDGLQIERSIQHKLAVSQTEAAPPAGLMEKLDKILGAIERGQIITIDKNLLVGGTAGAYDTALGERRALVEMGAL